MGQYFKQNKKLLIKWLLFELAYAFSMVIWSFFMANIADVTEGKGLGNVLNLFIFGIGFLLIYFFNVYLLELYSAKFINKCNISFKNDIFSSILAKDINSFNENNSAQYISILNNEIKTIEENYFKNIPTIISTCTLIIVSSIATIAYDTLLGIVTIIVSFLPIIVPYIMGDLLAKQKNKYMLSLENYNTTIKDIFNGFEIIKVSNCSEKFKEKFSRTNYYTEENLLKLRKKEALFHSIIYVMSYISAVLQITFSVYLVSIGRTTMGALLGIMQISNYISNPVSSMTKLIADYKSVKKIKLRIEELIKNTSVKSIDYQDKITVNTISCIILDNLSFGYKNDKNVIEDINFTFEKGKKYAIVGASGSGKTTLVKLIMNYYTEFDGNIFYDNIESQNIDKTSLYNNITLINQNVVLFDDTLENNITLFEKYPEEEILESLERAGILYIAKKEQGLKLKIDENGRNLSGGEKQRISIARAFLKNSPILILDESTSNLDNETAYNIENTVLYRENLTSIVITHKLNKNILKKYDSILVLLNGKLVEYDSFENLINQKGYFYNLYNFS